MHYTLTKPVFSPASLPDVLSVGNLPNGICMKRTKLASVVSARRSTYQEGFRLFCSILVFNELSLSLKKAEERYRLLDCKEFGFKVLKALMTI